MQKKTHDGCISPAVGSSPYRRKGIKQISNDKEVINALKKLLGSVCMY
jgi:hypothetical protein